MATTAQNARYHAKRKQLQPLRDIPQIPSDLANEAKYNHLTDAEEARMSEAIRASCAALHERRAFKEDMKAAYTPREFATAANSRNIFVIRSVAG